MLISTISISAEIQTYRAYSSAYATINQYTGKYTWSDWQSCNVPIVFDLNRDIITIYTNTTQYYSIVSDGETYKDSSGGTQICFRVVDQDSDRGTVRLRIERNGNSQLYVDFADVALAFNVRRTS